MVVATHNPESCASRAQHRDAHMAALEKIADVAPSKGVTLQGTWIEPTAHTIFVLAEAPNAHAVMEAVTDSGLIAFNSTRIHPVVDRDQALRSLPTVT